MGVGLYLSKKSIELLSLFFNIACFSKKASDIKNSKTMAQKPLDLEQVLRLIAEGHTQAEIGNKMLCGNNRLSQAVVGLANEGLIIKRKERAWRGVSTYELSPEGFRRIGQIIPPPQREPIAYAKPAVNWDGSELDDDRPAPMTLEEMAALKLSLPHGFKICQIKPRHSLITPNEYPYYLYFNKISLMRFASQVEAMIAANRLAEAMKWYSSPKFLDIMRDIMIASDCVSPFYDRVMENLRQRGRATWAN